MPTPKSLAHEKAALSDQFAMAALTGIMANHTMKLTDETRATAAEWAHKVARKMMEERNKSGAGTR